MREIVQNCFDGILQFMDVHAHDIRCREFMNGQPVVADEPTSGIASSETVPDTLEFFLYTADSLVDGIPTSKAVGYVAWKKSPDARTWGDLEIYNVSKRLETDVFRMGQSSKADKRYIGKHGDGLKVGGLTGRGFLYTL